MAQPSQRPSEGLFLANQRVELLQGARRALLLVRDGADAGDGRPRRGHGGDVEDAAADGGLADDAVVLRALLVVGGVDDDVDVPAGDEVHRVGLAVVQLVHALDRDAQALDDVRRAAGRAELEAALGKAAGDLRQLGLVAVVDGEEDLARQRDLGLGSLLRLEVGLAEVLAQAQDPPVERISGPSRGSTSWNMLKGKTASLTP